MYECTNRKATIFYNVRTQKKHGKQFNVWILRMISPLSQMRKMEKK